MIDRSAVAHSIRRFCFDWCGDRSDTSLSRRLIRSSTDKEWVVVSKNWGGLISWSRKFPEDRDVLRRVWKFSDSDLDSHSAPCMQVTAHP
jgi:hypothetical protein